MRVIDEIAFATNALKTIQDKERSYIAIHGKTSANTFGVYNNKHQLFMALKANTFADCVAAAELDPAKTIVLLTGASTTAIRDFAAAIGKIDLAATPLKRSPRKVIGWDQEVLLYENGHIKGYGNCCEYQYDEKTQKVLITNLWTNIPLGNAYQAGKDCIDLNQVPNLLHQWLEDWPPFILPLDATEIQQKELKDLRQKMKQSVSDLKSKNPFYAELVYQKECFWGWCHLWALEYHESHLRSDMTFICQVAAIYNQYTGNPHFDATSRADYLNAFKYYLKNCSHKTATIEELAEADLSLDSFKVRSERLTKCTSLTDFFAKRPTITEVLSKKWAILGDSEPNLEAQFTGNVPSQLPPAVFKTVSDFVAGYPYPSDAAALLMTVEKYRRNLTEQINAQIGKGAGLPNGLPISVLWKITSKTGMIAKQQGSRGALFEHWVREAWVQRGLFNTKQLKNGKEETILGAPNQGKLVFHFSVANETRTPLDKATPTSLKRVIDCSYTEKKTTQEAEATKCEIVGVELKHTTDKLSGEPLQQLYDNAKLVRAHKLRRIEYVFSTKDAALANKAIFVPPLTPNGAFSNAEKGLLFQVFFINDLGEKKIADFSNKN
ncbi:MAG: hypothetical protein RL329_1089 [Bacteroidota bacterium]